MFAETLPSCHKKAIILPQPMDPRWYQILFQLSFLLVGVFYLDFSIKAYQIGLTFFLAVLTQFIGMRVIQKKELGYKSALITAFGISLLLRSNVMWAHPLAAVIGVSSKFIFRLKGDHLFNPANLAIIVALSFFPLTWLSPGQWDRSWIFVLWLMLLGLTVVWKVHRSDISWIFLGTYLGLFALRSLWLGQPLDVWLHRFTDGALLLFTFFMISDPKTIPRDWRGRMIHGALTAAIAFVWQFMWFKTNALVWALFFSSLLVPVWNQIWPGEMFVWTKNRLKEAA